MMPKLPEFCRFSFVSLVSLGAWGEGHSATLQDLVDLAGEAPVLWLDAEDAATLTESGGKVSAWADKSGNSHEYSQGTAGNQPELIADAINGKPGISFDGADDYLGANTRLGLAANPDIMIFTVTVVDADKGNDDRVLQIGDSSMTLAVSTGVQGWAWRYDGGNETYATVAKDVAAIQCWERAEGTDFQSAKFYLDGTESARNTGGNDAGLPASTAVNSSIGAKYLGSGSPSNPFDGKIGEMIVLNLVDLDVRQKVEGYLAHKWGLTDSLPADHPFKAIDPTNNGEPPSIVLNGDALIRHALDTDFTDPGVTANDPEDGALTGDSISISYLAPAVPPAPIAADTYAGLQLWLKADEGFSPGGWADQSGNGNDATAHGNPELIDDGLNGLPVMRYSGANGESHRFTRISDIRTVFWVVKRNNNTFCYLLGDANAYHFHTPSPSITFWNNNAHVNVRDGRLMVNGVSTNGLTTNIPSEMSVISLRTTGNVQADSFSQDRNIGRNWNGDLAELLIYNTPLADDEIADIENRLNYKWGFPFKSSRATPDAFDSSLLGVWDITYTATDSDDNKVSVGRQVDVFNPDAPVITLLGEAEMHHEQGNDFADPGYTLADSEGTALDENDVVVDGVVDGHTPGVYLLKYDYTDGDGNVALQLLRTVEVSDTTPPAITLIGGESVKHPQGQPFLDPGYSAEDAIDGEVLVRSSEYLYDRILHTGFNFRAADQAINFVNNGGLLNTQPAGENYLTSAVNFAGDASFRSAGVGINQNDNFSNLFTGYFNAKVDGEYEFGVQREDDRGTFFLDLDQDGIFEEEGANGSEWLNNVYAGGFSRVQLQAGVYRFAAGHIEHGGGSNFELRFRTPPGAGPTSLTTIQPSQPVQKDLWLILNPINTGTLGTQTITYTATDSYGNVGTVTRIVEIIDPNVKPVITLAGRVFHTHEQYTEYVDPGFTVVDSDGNALDASGVEIDGEVDIHSSGKYELIYTFYDENGIPADPQIRVVTVKDTVAPVLELVGDAEMTLVQGEAFTDPGANLVDDPEAGITVTSNAAIPTNSLFMHLDAGNSAGSAPGALMGIWRDLSGNGNHLNDVRGDPMLVGDAMNGLPAVHLDGNDFMAASGSDVQSRYSIFAVSRHDGKRDGRLLGSKNRNWLMGHFNGSENAFHPEGWATPTSPTPVTQIPRLYTATSTGSNYVRFWADGVDVTTNNSRNGRIGKFQIGGYQANSNPSSGYVSEVLLYDNHVVTKAEQDTIWAYLGSKYGLMGYPKTTPPDFDTPGEYDILYTARDLAGNLTTITRKVTVTPDDTIPVITLDGERNVRIEYGADYTVPDYSVQDAEGNELDANQIVVGGSWDSTNLGMNTLTFDYTSPDGVPAETVYLNIYVVDTTGPEIVFNGEEVVRVKVGDPYTDPGVVATDAVDGVVKVYHDALVPQDGLVLHLDASSFKGVLNDGDRIQVAWQDQSGKGNHGNNFAGDPKWIESGPNGQPVVNFDGDDLIWTSRDFEPLLNHYTILSVARYTGGDSERVISSRGRNWIFGFHGNGVRKFHSDGWAHNSSGTDTEWHVHVGDVNDSAQANFWVDGQQLATNSTGIHPINYKPKVLQLGGWENNRESSKSEVAEVLIYNRILSDAERDAAMDYLNSKYDINGGGTFTNRFDFSLPGIHHIYYTAKDSRGNTSTAQRQIVVVSDDAKPYIVLNGLGESTLEAASVPVYEDPGAIAFAVDDTELDGDLQGQGSVDINVPGTYTIIYDFSDGGGIDADTVIRTVHIVDSKKPVITLNGDSPMTVFLEGKFEDPGGTSLDQLDGDTPVYSDYLSIPDVLRYEYFQLGNNAANLNFANNGGLLSRTPSTAQYFTSGPRGDGLYFREDNDFRTLHYTPYQGDRYQALVSGVFHAKREGIYEFESLRQDGNDYVTVWLDKDQNNVFSRGGAEGDERLTWDNAASTVYLFPGDYRVAFGYDENTGNSVFRVRFRTPEGAGPITLTNVNPSANNQKGLWSSFPYSLDTSTEAVHTIRYFATDRAGNQSVTHRKVIVREDTERPIILLVGDRDLDQHAGFPFEEPGYELIDYQGNPLDSSQVVVSGVPNGSKTGRFTVRYNFTDGDGHIADTQTRIVTVEDVLPPVITVHGANPATLQLGAQYQDAGATSIDKLDGPVIVSSDKALSTLALLGWWKFDDASGLVAKDETGRYDGTLVNFSGSEWVTGQNGGALEFNKANQNNQHVDLAPFQFGEGFSVAAWVKYESLENWSRIIGFGESNGPNAVLLANQQTSATVAFDIRDNVAAIGSLRPGNFWETGTWTHVAATVTDEGRMTLYKNGLEFATADGQAPPRVDRSNYYVGRSNWANDRRFRGVIDELMVYDRALNQSEVVSIRDGATALDSSTVGEQIVTYTAMDAHGNISTATRTVIVVDEPNLPVITLLGDATVEHSSGQPYVDAGATVANAFGGPLDASGLVYTDNVNTELPGTYTISYDFTDGDGKAAATVVRTVHVKDQSPPVITLVGGETIRHQLGNRFVDPGFSAEDAVEGVVSVESSMLRPGRIRVRGYRGGQNDNILNLNGNGGMYNLTPLATREDYVRGPQNQGIHVRGDGDARSIISQYPGGNFDNYQLLFDGHFHTSTGGLYEFGVQQPDERAGFWIDLDGDGVFETNGDFGTELMNPGWQYGYRQVELEAGYHKFAVAYRDGGGGGALEARFRAITGEGPASLTYVHPGWQPNHWVLYEPIDVLTLGEQQITYTATDSIGNVATVVRTIIVENNPDAGIITLNGEEEMSVPYNSTFEDPGATVADLDGNALPLDNLVITGEVDTSRLGKYTLEYNFTNAEGIVSRTAKRTVFVVDDEPPVITLNGEEEMEVIQGTVFTDPGVSALDNYDGDFLLVGSSENFPRNGLVVHLDASEIKGKSDGDLVDLWYDLSGRDHHADVVAGTPTYSSTALNGLPAIHFDGDSQLGLSQEFWRNYTILTVSQLSGSLNQRLLSSRDRNWLLGYYRDTEDRFHVDNGWVTITQRPASTRPHLYTATSFEQNAHFYADGIDKTGLSDRRDTNMNMGYFQMGAWMDRQEASVGDVAEVIIYNRVLKESERRGVEARLNAKYGLNGVTAVNTPVDTTQLGEYHVVYQTVDIAGNLATATRKVTVVPDPTAPTITLNGDAFIIHEASADYTDEGAVLKDASGTVMDAGLMTVTSDVDSSIPGLYSVTYSYQPGAGNPAVPVTRTVEVKDTVGPVITLDGETTIKLEVGETYTEPGFSASDASTHIAPIYSNLDYTPGQLLHQGYHQNRDNAKLNINNNGGILNDTPNGQSFLINGPGDRGLDFNGDRDFRDAGAGVNRDDNFHNLFTGVLIAPKPGNYEFGIIHRDDTATIWVDLDQDGTFESNGDKGNEQIRGAGATGYATRNMQPGVYKVAFIHQEGGGGSGFHVGFRLPGGVRQNVKPGAPDQQFLWATPVTDPLDTTVPGTHLITYSSVDQAGNVTTATRTVVVVEDAALPFISLNGDNVIEIEAGETFTDPLATVTDDNTEVRNDLAGVGTVDTSTVGEYTLTYDFTDGDGNVADTVTRKVLVVDTTAPTASLVAHASGGTDTVTITVGQTWEDPGVDIQDVDSAAWFVSNRDYIPNRLNYAGYMMDHSDNHVRFERDDDLFHRTPVGQGFFTTGPRDRGYDFANDQDFQRGPTAITSNDRFQTLVWGYFYAEADGEYEFRGDNMTHRLAVYLDVDNSDHLTDVDRLTWNNETKALTLTKGYYKFGVGFSHNNGGASGRVQFKTPDGTTNGDGLTVLKPANKSQAGRWLTAGVGPIDTNFTGTHEITYYVMDHSGNMTTLRRTVIIEPDPDAPILTLNGDAEIAHQQGEDFTDPGVVAKDSSDQVLNDPAPVPTITLAGQVVAAVDGTVAGTYEIQYDFTDNDGRKAIPVFRTVVVADTEAPVITLIGNNPITIPPGSDYEDLGATAVDGLDGDVNVVFTSSSPALGYTPGLMEGAFNGWNANTPNPENHGIDPLGPSRAQIQFNGGITIVYTGEIYDEDGKFSFRENLDDRGWLKVNNEVLLDNSSWNTPSSATRDYGTGGWFDFELRINNGAGGGGAVAEPGKGFQYDPEGGTDWQVPWNASPSSASLFRAIGTQHNTVDTSTEGTQTITFTATDAAGNRSTIIREIIIKDDLTLPVIVLEGGKDMTLEAGEPFVDPGYRPEDRRGNALDGDVTVEGSVDHTRLGFYELTYNYTDAEGRKAGTQKRTVTVVDTTPPEITLTDGQFYRISVGQTYLEPGYTVTDNVDTNLTVSSQLKLEGLAPVALWDFNESDGTIAHDKMNNLNGTLINFPAPVADSWVPGLYGNALKFENTAHIRVAGSELLDLQQFTISLWVRSDNYNRGMFLFEKSKGNIINSQYNLYLDDGTVNFRTFGTDSTDLHLQADNSGLELGDWQHIAATYDGVNKMIYINGELIDIGEHDSTLATDKNGPSYIGAWAPGDGYYFQGWMDDLKIYDQVFPESEINNLSKQSGVDTSEIKKNPYEVTYTSTDSSGNVAEKIRYIVVSNDTTPPTITLIDLPELTVDLNAEFTDPGATANDNQDGDISAKLAYGGSVDTSKAGVYTLTYDVTDLSYNQATQVTRTVTVGNPTEPTDPLEQWVADHLGSVTTQEQDPLADPDKDQMENILEYALGGNPSAEDSSDTRPVVAESGGKLTVTFYRLKHSVDPDITYTVQLTTSLTTPNWDDTKVDVALAGDQDGVPGPNYEKVIATAKTAMADEPDGQQFIRIQVDRPE